jgi:hypothetical protein
MIRATDFVTTAGWVRPPSAPSASDGVDSASWFDAEAPQGNTTISADVSPQARSLSAEQHAQRVLSYLSDDTSAA